MKTAKLRQIKRLYFGCEDIAKTLGITLASAKVTANRYAKNGFLVRIKRNVYVLRDVWENLDQESVFALANVAQVPSYISLMTALSYYEVTTQIQRGYTESVAIKRTKEIGIGRRVFTYSKINRGLYFGFSKNNDVFIATPEKAFLDALYLMSLKRYKFDLTSIDFDKLDVSLVKKLSKKFPKRTQVVLLKNGYFKKA